MMWINIEVIPGKNREIYLPLILARRLDKEVTVSFGMKDVTAGVEVDDGLSTDGGDEFDSPLKIRISTKLAYLLRIPDSLVYRMKYDKGSIILGPTIGLLMGNRTHVYSPDHMMKYTDRFGIYNKLGGFVCAFSPKTVDWENLLAYGLYYNFERNTWQYGRFPIPSSIYRRDFHSDPADIKKLIEITGGRLFNSWRFSKYYLYQYVSKYEELSSCLPATETTESYEQVKDFIDRHDKAILKPVGLSRGRGICIIRKDNETYNVDDYRTKIPRKLELDETSLQEYFEYNPMFFKQYIIQQFIALANVDGGLFDIRVVMQKDSKGRWKCSGIECRVAGKDTLVTNISRGGYALELDEALKKAFPEEKDHGALKRRLYQVCHKLCRALDDTGHHFAEFGMDIAIDEDKRFWIIEVNVFPSFKGFKKMNNETYLNIRYTPMYYAAALSGFSIENDRGENNV